MSTPLLTAVDLDSTIARLNEMWSFATFLQVIPLLLLCSFVAQGVKWIVYASDENEICEKVAGSAQTPQERLAELAAHRSVAVRAAVALNKNTTTEVLLSLSGDRSAEVRLAAATRIKEVLHDWEPSEDEQPVHQCDCGEDGEYEEFDCWRFRIAA